MIRSPEPDTTASDSSLKTEQPKNFISQGWLNLNLLWDKSELARGLTGAILGALLTAPWGNSQIIFIGIGLGAFAFSMDLIPWRKFSPSSEQKQEERYKQQIQRCNSAIERDPQDPVAYFRRGMVYAEKGNQEQAIVDYKQVLALAANPALRLQAEQQLASLLS
jgi:tetratricopeptide (TPR) repeat protein